MEEQILYLVGLLGCVVVFIYGVYKLVNVFKINDKNSEQTICKFTHVLKLRYILFGVMTRYDFEYKADDITYEDRVSLFPLFGFTDEQLANGVPVRYLKTNPSRCELVGISHAPRVLGWLIVIAGSIAGTIFCFGMVSGL
ncbi:hypothetical protein [Treponema sp.]|uniref:hypothetical protein n=1 Tax=Treponema sp. TaxID=166 RepID=UPI00298D8277|nr:hypothetical protein [Treponema sp.]MCR5613010.1 hypothetical protein [Treponema sp.]